VTTEKHRAAADACPGLLSPHYAADGPLIRLRIPGGQTTSSTLLELSRIASAFGEGSLQLTSRGNLQLRGLDEHRLPEVESRVRDAGLLPSWRHERIRNIVASPLTGLTDERPDLRPMISELDRAILAVPELAELPGRFLFALDDGRGDVAPLKFDLAYVATSWTGGVVLVGDRDHGIPTTTSNAVPLIIDLAERFIEVRATLTPPPWHVRETPEPIVATTSGFRCPVTVRTGVPLGMIGDAASVAAPLSLLDPRKVATIEGVSNGGPVVITPWRGLVIPGAADFLSSLSKAGLIVDAMSNWSRLTACVGSPSCAKSRIDTRALAGLLANGLDPARVLPIHVSGCERRCGAPGQPHCDLVAPGSLELALAQIDGAR
jgi:precorrin-3B synthase